MFASVGLATLHGKIEPLRVPLAQFGHLHGKN